MERDWQTSMDIEMDIGLEGIGENLEEDNVEGMDHEHERSIYNRQLLLCHLNINSVQNKFEELRGIILKSKI